MGKISEGEIDKELEKLKRDIKRLEEEYEKDFSGQYVVSEENEENDYDEIGNRLNEINAMSQKKCKLERLKDIKKEGDEYVRLYPNGYDSIIHGQNDLDVEDLLYRKEEAKIVADKIKNKNIKTAGVFGDWGTGKSTFLEYVKDELDSDENITTVKIDASEYSDQEKIWAYIYSTIYSNLNGDIGKKIKFCFSRIRSKWFYLGFNIVISVLGIVFLAYPLTTEIVNHFGIVVEDDSINKFIVNSLIFIAYIYLYIKCILPRIVEINSGIKHVGAWLKKSVLTPSQDDVLGYKIEIKRNLDDILKVWNKNIVLLVDELDRCNENVVSSFFDTIQLFQHSERIQIVYAVDRKVVERALVNTGIPSDNIDNYLKKYIDYRINIYPLNKESGILESIIKQYNFTQIETICIHTFIQKHLNVNITIRDLKEILNFLCEIKKEWLDKDIFTKRYEDDDNYVVSFRKFIPWAIYAFTDSKWITYTYEDSQHIISVSPDDYDGVEFMYIIITDEMRKKYHDCPEFFKKLYVREIVQYKELISKYKVI